ncbi:phospholipase D-like domain-containing protein [Halorussus salinus]|uniref:phospholipase D-like domain-containing protein n=1 Tax=Halorussus salinus TaxID=1364935 RepID=UPI00138EE948|nr:phospholipase D-like domain-containing protein [Halorussus salinus]
MKLLYHDFDGNGGVSPFNDTLEELSNAESLAIASPYITLSILRELIDSCESWRLITDVQEWMRTQSADQRDSTIEFIKKNRESIHDCRNLHAKLVVGDATAFIGSANLTDAGLSRNAEIGVRLDDESETAELQQWFEQLWSHTELTDFSELQTYADDVQSTTDYPTVSMTNTGPSINNSLPFSKPSSTPVEDTQHEDLVEAVEHTPSKEWIEAYFDWISKLIDFTGLDEGDERIATTVPTSRKIAVNVNQRYVLTAYLDQAQIGLMLPGDSIAVTELSEYISDFGQFSTPSDTDPYWFEFPTPLDVHITNTIEEDWQRAVQTEMSRAERSSHRNSHNPAVYRTAVNREYRKKVLSKSFQ